MDAFPELIGTTEFPPYFKFRVHKPEADKKLETNLFRYVIILQLQRCSFQVDVEQGNKSPLFS